MFSFFLDNSFILARASSLTIRCAASGCGRLTKIEAAPLTVFLLSFFTDHDQTHRSGSRRRHRQGSYS